jgi:secreted trypsin-like serine protease
VITGWGLLANRNHPVILQRLNLAIWNQNECNDKWYGKITSSMFCAGGESGSDTCSGDSGGALTVNGIQVGIVSAGANDCGSVFPTVFVNLTNFNVRAFIRETTGV